MPNINSNTFKNSSSPKGSKKNPFVPFIIIVVLALAAVMINNWVIDVNTEMRKQIEEQQQQQEQEEQESQQQEEEQDSTAAQ